MQTHGLYHGRNTPPSNPPQPTEGSPQEISRCSRPAAAGGCVPSTQRRSLGADERLFEYDDDTTGEQAEQARFQFTYGQRDDRPGGRVNWVLVRQLLRKPTEENLRHLHGWCDRWGVDYDEVVADPRGKKKGVKGQKALKSIR
jgi:hypothetical protein